MPETPEPWNFTEAQRRQFREAHAEAKRREMTSASHDTPPRQPDENEPLDHPDRDVLDFIDFIDETVARITDADVDEHLRKVLGQAGYRRRHVHGEQAEKEEDQ
jgi:hypothetical protein